MHLKDLTIFSEDINTITTVLLLYGSVQKVKVPHTS